MIALQYKKNGAWSMPYYLRDFEWKAAKKAFSEYVALHGHENARIQFVDDLPLPEYEFWHSRWARI